MNQNQYFTDIISGLAERTIKRLWIIIIVLVLYCGFITYMYVDLRGQVETCEITQDVMQETNGENSRNYFAGGDVYGSAAESTNEG